MSSIDNQNLVIGMLIYQRSKLWLQPTNKEESKDQKYNTNTPSPLDIS